MRLGKVWMDLVGFGGGLDGLCVCPGGFGWVMFSLGGVLGVLDGFWWVWVGVSEPVSRWSHSER